jgi:putative copper resistance protein D
MHAAYLVSVWVHVVAAMVWVGGMVFFAVVLVPLSRSPEFRDRAPALLRLSGERFRLLGWVCLTLLVGTGIANLLYRGVTWTSLTAPGLLQDPWRDALVHKMGLVALILILSAAHDFWIGPKVATLLATPGQEKRARRLAKAASWFARVNLLLALAVVALALRLVRG